MKIFPLLVLSLFLGCSLSAEAQMKTSPDADPTSDQQYSLNASEKTLSQSQIEVKYTLYNKFLLGLMFDEQAAWGFGVIVDKYMGELMFGEGDDGLKLKGGYVLGTYGDADLNLSVYGMGGFASYEVVGETRDGFLLEPGLLLGVADTFMIGAGYPIDFALEEEYFSFRIMVFL